MHALGLPKIPSCRPHSCLPASPLPCPSLFIPCFWSRAPPFLQLGGTPHPVWAIPPSLLTPCPVPHEGPIRSTQLLSLSEPTPPNGQTRVPRSLPPVHSKEHLFFVVIILFTAFLGASSSFIGHPCPLLPSRYWFRKNTFTWMPLFVCLQRQTLRLNCTLFPGVSHPFFLPYPCFFLYTLTRMPFFCTLFSVDSVFPLDDFLRNPNFGVLFSP